MEDSKGDMTSPKKPKRLTIQKKFVERMDREGRGADWRTLVKRLMQETGKRYGQVIWDAMREMGYSSAKEENRLYKEFLESEKSKQDALIEYKAEAKAEEISGGPPASFNEVFKVLPDLAPAAIEIGWIRSHPAMARKSSSGRAHDPVEITAKDIEGAPSKGAVIHLQHAANHPSEFFKALQSEWKKETEAEEQKAEARVEDVSLEEVRRLLKEVTGGS